MSRPFRAAYIAALSLCALIAGHSAPSLADDRIPQQMMLASLSVATNPNSLRVPSVETVQPAPVTVTTIAPATRSQEKRASIAPPAPTLASLVERNLNAESISREQECLAGAVYFEAKSETLEGQLAVAEVIRNRAASGRFPSSLCSVVFQRSQFSFVRGGDLPPINRASNAWRRAVAVASIATDRLWESGASEALFFHASHVAPGWRNLTRVRRIGNHVFYR